MEWRGAQLNGCQFTHGMIHNVLYTGILLKDILKEVGEEAKLAKLLKFWWILLAPLAFVGKFLSGKDLQI